MMYILYKDNDREALDIVLVRLPHVRTVVQKKCNLQFESEIPLLQSSVSSC